MQILPPPDDAPDAEEEMAEHPFILEFPIMESNLWPITNHRRIREHRKITLLLNVLLAGHTTFQAQRAEHFWASIRYTDRHEIKWVQRFYFAKLGSAVIDDLSPIATELLEEMEPEEYYSRVGHDGRGLRVPADLDDSISLYQNLPSTQRDQFDRAAFWLEMARRQWNVAVSSSFASLVTAVESLTNRGAIHQVYCEHCKADRQHEVPGATSRFRDFFEEYTPGAVLKRWRDEMYSLRSGILHGSELMQLDQDLAFGWDPPWWKERELHDELWTITRLAVRNWLKGSAKK